MSEPPSTDPRAEAGLREELEATREKIAAYGALIEQLPGIYERKFRERIDPALERNRRLSEEGGSLRRQLSAGLPGGASADPPPRSLPSAALESAVPEPAATAAAGRSPDRRLGLGLALAGAVAVAGGLLLNAQRPPSPALKRTEQQQQPAQAAAASGPKSPGASPEEPDSTAPSLPEAGELLLRSDGVSWLEVRDLEDRVIFRGLLEGEKRFPLEEGLRLLAGRPDLVTVHPHGSTAAVLGPIEQIAWRTIRPTPSR
jgi:hypothetical protein